MNTIISGLEALGVIFCVTKGSLSYMAVKPKRLRKKKDIEGWQLQVDGLLGEVAKRKAEAIECLRADERRIFAAAQRFSGR